MTRGFEAYEIGPQGAVFHCERPSLSDAKRALSVAGCDLGAVVDRAGEVVYQRGCLRSKHIDAVDDAWRARGETLAAVLLAPLAAPEPEPETAPPAAVEPPPFARIIEPDAPSVDSCAAVAEAAREPVALRADDGVAGTPRRCVAPGCENAVPLLHPTNPAQGALRGLCVDCRVAVRVLGRSRRVGLAEAAAIFAAERTEVPPEAPAEEEPAPFVTPAEVAAVAEHNAASRERLLALESDLATARAQVDASLSTLLEVRGALKRAGLLADEKADILGAVAALVADHDALAARCTATEQRAEEHARDLRTARAELVDARNARDFEAAAVRERDAALASLAEEVAALRIELAAARTERPAGFDWAWIDGLYGVLVPGTLGCDVLIRRSVDVWHARLFEVSVESTAKPFARGEGATADAAVRGLFDDMGAKARDHLAQVEALLARRAA